MRVKNVEPNINLATNFLITIYHQENNSWQGAIEWLDSGKKLHFRSYLEMLSLMQEAVSSQSAKANSLRSWQDEKTIKAI